MGQGQGAHTNPAVASPPATTSRPGRSDVVDDFRPAMIGQVAPRLLLPTNGERCGGEDQSRRRQCTTGQAWEVSRANKTFQVACVSSSFGHERKISQAGLSPISMFSPIFQETLFLAPPLSQHVISCTQEHRMARATAPETRGNTSSSLPPSSTGEQTHPPTSRRVHLTKDPEKRGYAMNSMRLKWSSQKSHFSLQQSGINTTSNGHLFFLLRLSLVCLVAHHCSRA